MIELLRDFAVCTDVREKDAEQDVHVSFLHSVGKLRFVVLIDERNICDDTFILMYHKRCSSL